MYLQVSLASPFMLDSQFLPFSSPILLKNMYSLSSLWKGTLERKFEEDYVTGTDSRERSFSTEIGINHGYLP